MEIGSPLLRFACSTALLLAGPLVHAQGPSSRQHSLIRAGSSSTAAASGPTVQEAYLKAFNTDQADEFGGSVAVFGDTAVVGARGEASSATSVNGDGTDNSARLAGAAYVFVRNAGTWTQQAYLKPDDTGAVGRFGTSVAIFEDTIVVGANSDNHPNQNGAAYVFVRNAGIWSQQARLDPPTPSGYNYFGAAVALSGNTALVGAPLSGMDGSLPGAAYVFVRDGTSWSLQAELATPDPSPGDGFGFALAIDGDTVVVSAPGEDSGATGVDGDSGDDSAIGAGAAFVFVRVGTTWTQQAYLKSTVTSERDTFGRSVSISGDSIVAGAPNAVGSPGNSGPGLAHVYVRNGSTWSHQALVRASNATRLDRFGDSVSISGDRLLIGASREAGGIGGVNSDQDDDTVPGAGAAYLFVRKGPRWIQQDYLKASNPGADRNTNGDQFGWAAALHGTTAIVGAIAEGSGATGVNGDQDDNSAVMAGAAYAFAIEPRECFVLDFETEDDFATPLVNGQHLDTEFGTLVVLTSSGPNAGMAIFDTTPGGPNDPSQDRDLLVDSGNALILQTENFPPDASDVFPRPNDDEDGGTLTFDFLDPVEASSVRLIDVDAADADWTVDLTDVTGRRRTYTVPGGWTGDLLAGGPGSALLDLATIVPQTGLAGDATAVQDEGFDSRAVVRVAFTLGSSGAIDDLSFCRAEAQAYQASARSRDGAGLNRHALTCTAPPVLGQAFTARIDCSAAGPGTAWLELRRSPAAGVFSPRGEVLIGGELVHRTSRVHSGTYTSLSWQVPPDASLAGLPLFAQGGCVGATASGRLRLASGLSNALDLVLGNAR